MNPPPGNVDEWLLSTLLNKPMGRAKGQPNFRGDEDVMLASAYVVVTTNAAIGTDQNGATFWEKIRVSFVQRGGNAGRNACSLQNRFNKVLQMEVNKYIGMLMSVLREYHSGWVLDDYVNGAKRKFLVKFCKGFKHDLVYIVLKKSLPKYEINISALDLRVRRALFFCDNDNAVPFVDGEGGDVAVVAPAGGAVPGIGMCTPRPSIGKKKAKANEYIRKQQMLASDINKKQKTEVELANAKVIAERGIAIASLVASAQLKNDLVQQQFAYQLFMQTYAVESQAFFAAMRKKYSARKYMEEVPPVGFNLHEDVVDIVDDTEDRNDDEDDHDEDHDEDNEDNEDDDDEDHEDYKEHGLFIPRGFKNDTVLDNIVAECARMPVIQISKIVGSDFSQNSVDYNLGTPPPLPMTQKLLAALQSNEEDVRDVEDTQLTTLSL
ncbi:No apical meristem-associated C-terminal domain [Fragilaria crotonensis]|nr:No apical meristem-associated C-terminal domain [Fragilaria crotonensis]